MVLNLDKFQEVVRDAFEYTKRVRIYFCRKEEPLVRSVERNLLWDLQPSDTKPGTMSEPSERLRIIHQNATWATDQIRRQIQDFVEFE